MQMQSLKALQRERFLSSQHTNMMPAVMTGTQGTVIASYVMAMTNVVIERSKNKAKKNCRSNGYK